MERVKKVHSTGGFGSQVFIEFYFYRSGGNIFRN